LVVKILRLEISDGFPIPDEMVSTHKIKIRLVFGILISERFSVVVYDNTCKKQTFAFHLHQVATRYG